LPSTPNTRAADGRLVVALVALFFLSGVAALIYQVLWLRLLSLVFGVTIYAASTVLAAFMGGLALGSAMAGRLADRLRRPLLWFGVVELLIALTALATPLALEGVKRAYLLAQPVMPESVALVTVFRFLGSSAVLLVPTALMGATLPLVLKSSLTRLDALGSRVGLLYGTNTLGAIVGSLTAGFYLLPHIGVRASFFLAAAINVAVGLGGLLASRRLAPAAATASDGPPAEPVPAGDASVADDAPVGLGLRRLVLAVFVISGFASLALEVVWFRVLVIFLRPTAYAFTVMLATVLGGIAIGSYLITPFMRRRWNWVIVLAGLEMGIAVLAVLSFAALGLSFPVIDWSLPWLGSEGARYVVPLVIASLLAIFPAALLFGAAFPVGLRLYAGGASAGHPDTARRIGVFYSLNVCGAIAGSVAAGFVLLPWLGSRGSLIVVALLVLASGLALLVAWPSRGRRAGIALGLAAFAAAAVAVPDPFDFVLKHHRRGERQLWREEGVQTTVAIHERNMGQPTPSRVMYLDGSHQANDTPGGAYVHHRIGFLPVAVHPDPRRALVVGLGGGATPGAIGRFPGIDVTVVELSRGVARGSEWFRHVNFDLLARPNVRLRVDDGRNYLLLTRNRYDIITADIIIPTHAGSSNLYSLQYYELVKRALAEDGLVLQWLAADSEWAYKLLVRTFLAAFPDATMWADGSLFLAGKQPLTLRRDWFELGKMQDPATREVLTSMGIDSFETLLSLYVAGPEEIRRYVGEGPILTDDRPVLEYFLAWPDDQRPVDLSGVRGDVSRHLR
jgi:spermidine synthase